MDTLGYMLPVRIYIFVLYLEEVRIYDYASMGICIVEENRLSLTPHKDCLASKMFGTLLAIGKVSHLYM